MLGYAEHKALEHLELILQGQTGKACAVYEVSVSKIRTLTGGLFLNRRQSESICTHARGGVLSRAS